MSIINKKFSFLKSQEHSGFTLLEVMIAMVIFSIGLLGLAGLQGQSIQYSHSAYLRSQATFLAYDILDKMRANREVAIQGNYNALFSSAGADKNCYSDAGNCIPVDLALHDVYNWKQLLTTLPDGNGSISSLLSSGVTTFTVIVSWKDRSSSNTNKIETISIESEV